VLSIKTTQQVSVRLTSLSSQIQGLLLSLKTKMTRETQHHSQMLLSFSRTDTTASTCQSLASSECASSTKMKMSR